MTLLLFLAFLVPIVQVPADSNDETPALTQATDSSESTTPQAEPDEAVPSSQAEEPSDGEPDGNEPASPIDPSSSPPQDVNAVPEPTINQPPIITGVKPVHATAAAVPVHYHIDVTLDPESKTLNGQLRLNYTNRSPDIIPDLRFHLYLNGFLNNRSTFALGGSLPGDDAHWGYQKVRDVRVNGQVSDWEYFVTPDAAEEDKTVMRLPLKAPLFPGDSVDVMMNFEARLPKAWRRTGYGADHFFVAQWYPKPGVWQTKGYRGVTESGWNCHPFFRDTEFYANFANFRVSIRVPHNYIVGATGRELADQRVTETDYTVHTFEQERVHDFAFTAGRRLLRFERDYPIREKDRAAFAAFRKKHGFPPREEPVIKMILLLQKDHKGQEDRHFDALSTAIDYHANWYGPYPYDTLTMVDPATDARATGGMEYPTLVTLGTHLILPERDLDLEEVLVHEYGHQYWYGMVANNEFEDPWLDEGINTYTSAKIIDAAYGPTPEYISLARLLPLFSIPPDRFRQLGSLRVSPYQWMGIRDSTFLERYRIGTLDNNQNDAVLRDGWTYDDNFGYNLNAYYKPALFLHQLEKELGEDTMSQVMRTWFVDQAFRHPTAQDFFDHVNTVSERDMNWFFDELFAKPGFLDYAVDEVQTSPSQFNGYRLDDHAAEPVLIKTGDAEEGETVGRQVVTIRNLGTIRYPTEIQVTFADGNQNRVSWDGSYPWAELVFEHPSEIIEVVIDPEQKLVIDKNRANNSLVVARQEATASRWSLRWLLSVQNLLHSIAGGL